jgi:hypothetical protein
VPFVPRLRRGAFADRSGDAAARKRSARTDCCRFRQSDSSWLVGWLLHAVLDDPAACLHLKGFFLIVVGVAVRKLAAPSAALTDKPHGKGLRVRGSFLRGRRKGCPFAAGS